MYLNTVTSITEPVDRYSTLWGRPNLIDGTTDFYIWAELGGWTSLTRGGSSGSVTWDNITNKPAFPNFITNGDGNSYLSNDGTYKPMVGGPAYTAYPDFSNFPQPGESGILYLDASTGDLYYWDGTDYVITDAGLFSNYLPLSGGTITGNLVINGTLNGITLEDYLKYTYNNDTPILALQPGTKITSASVADATVHEILGVNTYDTPKVFDQTEVGSPEALFNINIVYDDELTQGHATADVYNEDGSPKSKEVFVYASDLAPQYISSTGTSTTVTGLPTNAIISRVVYNRLDVAPR